MVASYHLLDILYSNLTVSKKSVSKLRYICSCKKYLILMITLPGISLLQGISGDTLLAAVYEQWRDGDLRAIGLSTLRKSISYEKGRHVLQGRHTLQVRWLNIFHRNRFSTYIAFSVTIWQSPLLKVI